MPGHSAWSQSYTEMLDFESMLLSVLLPNIQSESRYNIRMHNTASVFIGKENVGYTTRSSTRCQFMVSLSSLRLPAQSRSKFSLPNELLERVEDKQEGKIDGSGDDHCCVIDGFVTTCICNLEILLCIYIHRIPNDWVDNLCVISGAVV